MYELVEVMRERLANVPGHTCTLGYGHVGDGKQVDRRITGESVLLCLFMV